MVQRKVTKTYRSDVLAAIHDTISQLHEADLVDEETLSKFDKLCVIESLEEVRDFLEDKVALKCTSFEPDTKERIEHGNIYYSRLKSLDKKPSIS